MHAPSPPEAHQHSGHLRRFADWLDQHPDIEPHSLGMAGAAITAHVYAIDSAEELAETARKLGGKWAKKAEENSELFSLTREVVPGVAVELTGWRHLVCERVVVGTRQVEVEEPDPEAVAALPKVKRTQVVEDVEWRCEPLLGREAA